MNIIKISALDDLSLIINDTLCISGIQSEEIDLNMWCVGLDDDFISSITVEQLKNFLDSLIEKKEQQLNCVGVKKNIIFYMWFDQQALQLRFNVITGDAKSLPFKSKVQLLNIPDFILNDFIDTVRNVSRFGDEVEFFDNNDENRWDEDENEDEYILNVFVKELNVNEIKS